MSGTDPQLYTLYRQLAQIQSRHGRAGEAADHYALALYYARRLGKAEEMRFCRAQILGLQPNHAAVSETPAPLLFAQLLIRYPADEAATKLDLMRHAGLAGEALGEAEASLAHEEAAPALTPFATEAHDRGAASPPRVGASAEPAVESRYSREEATPASPRLFGEASGLPAWETPAANEEPAILSFASASTTPPKVKSVAEPPVNPFATSPAPRFENHHVYDLGSDVAGPAVRASRVVDDYLSQERILSKSPADLGELGFWGSAVNALAMFTAAAGVVLIGFFSFKLYPELKRFEKIEVARLLREPTPALFPPPEPEPEPILVNRVRAPMPANDGESARIGLKDPGATGPR